MPEHFRVPFQVSGTRAQTVEQDSIDEIAQCVTAILTCPVGAREEKPNFGTPDQVFQMPGVDTTDLTRAVSEQEPRASVLISSAPNVYDELVHDVTVNIRGGAGV